MDHLIIMDRENIGGKPQINFTSYAWVVSKGLIFLMAEVDNF
jgi:hypothetical protein